VSVEHRYELFGARICLELPAKIEEVLGPALGDLPVLGDEATRGDETRIVVSADGLSGYDVTVDGRVTHDGLDIGTALYAALVDLNQEASVAAARDHAVLHAGVLEVDGVGIAVVGHSGAGKTTLTAAGVLGGFGYVADEIAAIDSSSVVQPYHRPLGLRGGGAALLGMVVSGDPRLSRIMPLRIGGRGRLAQALPLGAVVLLERHRTEAATRRLGPAEALVRLADHTLGDDGTESTMFRRLERLVKTIPLWEMHYSAIDGALDELRRLVAEVST